MKRLTVFLLIAAIWTSVLSQPKNSNALSDPCKILFLGSSYFYFNNLMEMFGNLADSSGRKILVDYHFGGGYFLDDHADCPITDSLIKTEKWDYVILQGVGSYTAYPDKLTEHKVEPALRVLKRKISTNSVETKTVFCLPWAFEDGMTWMGWPDDYSSMQKKIYDKTLELAEGIGLVIAPVGWAWNTVLEFRGFPLHYLHRQDWNHPSREGSYLMACVIYATLFQETVSGNPYHHLLEKTEAEYFQSVASKTVLSDLELWHIPELVLAYENSEGYTQFGISPLLLIQNYPNPFIGCTNITYQTREAGRVEFSVYDLSGKSHYTRTIEQGSPGSYGFRFDGEDLAGGLYYYTLEQNDNIATGKMILIKR